MALKDSQQSALDNLATLLTEATTGLKRVHKDQTDALSELPALVLFDAGLIEERQGQWREMIWTLTLRAFVQIGKLETAMAKVRDVRADLVDQLGTDITLGGAVSNTFWQTPMTLVPLEYNGIDYAGCEGNYALVIREARAFA